MARNHKPRHRYVPKRIDPDPLGLATARVALLTDATRAEFITPMTTSMAALKAGTGGWPAWCQLADALNVAERLADLGICNDQRPAINAGQAALGAIHDRHAQRDSWTLRGSEVLALEGTADQLGALDVHRIQLQHCSQGELADAITSAKRRVQQALAGNAPANAIVCVGALGHLPQPTYREDLAP